LIRIDLVGELIHQSESNRIAVEFDLSGHQKTGASSACLLATKLVQVTL